jgi:hypothetical protein
MDRLCRAVDRVFPANGWIAARRYVRNPSADFFLLSLLTSVAVSPTAASCFCPCLSCRLYHPFNHPSLIVSYPSSNSQLSTSFAQVCSGSGFPADTKPNSFPLNRQLLAVCHLFAALVLNTHRASRRPEKSPLYGLCQRSINRRCHRSKVRPSLESAKGTKDGSLL